MNPWMLWFHFPEGGVWSNIIASLIWTAPIVLYSRAKIIKMSLDAKNQRENNMRKLIQLHKQHHKEVLEALSGKKRNK